jgi:hypothetical protein
MGRHTSKHLRTRRLNQKRRKQLMKAAKRAKKAKS